MNVAQQAEYIKKLERELYAMKTGAEMLRKEVREAKKLIVALVTSEEDVDIDEHGIKTFKFFLHDRYIAMVDHNDVFTVTYDSHRLGNVYRVVR
jgi:hypothetical protein